MLRLLMASCLAFLWVGCAGGRVHSRADEPALPLGQPEGEPLLVSGANITGPSSSLLISGEAMHGRFRDQPVAMKWSYQSLDGALGTSPIRLELAEGDDTRIWGSFAGAAVDIIVEPQWLYGQVGACGYSLRRVPAGYVGQRSCNGALESEFDLAFPEPLLERPLGERAALMALMLVNHDLSQPLVLSIARFVPPRELQAPPRACGSPLY